MREVEKGRMKLDDPVNAYLPQPMQFPDEGFHNPIRIRDLMDHAAGLEDLELGTGIMTDDPKKVQSLEHYLTAHRPRRVREPGADPGYCNYCAALAGYIVARLEGTDYQTLVEREIFAPLGMISTTAREPRPEIPGLPAPMPAVQFARTSDGFTWNDNDFSKEKPELTDALAPAGAIWSNADDMARYMIAQLNGGELDGARIYSAGTAKAFRTPLLATPKGINGWNHGFIALPLPGGFTGVGHGGDSLMFHGDMTLVPELSLGIFVDTNTDTGVHLAKRLSALIVQHFYARGEAREATAPAKIDPASLTPFTGAWLGTRRAYHRVEGFVELLDETDISATDHGLALGTRIFVPDGANRFRERNGEVVLSFDLKNGKAVKARRSDNTETLERPQWWQDLTLYLVIAGLALAAAIATLIGPFVRPRGLPRSPAQAWAEGVQAAAAAGWITAMIALALWLPSLENAAKAIFSWPSPLSFVFSGLGGLSAALSAISVLMIVPVWRGQGWSRWRKARYSVTAVLLAALSLLTFMRGGLDIASL